jgi:hypothetical protein
MSDGLVLIENATVRGAPRAFVYRSHSGHYGVVNSEEGFQNLVRFLFGDVRIDGVLEVHELTLPPRLERKRSDGARLRASYYFETVVRVRGARYDLHRRLFIEGSAILRSYDEMLQPALGDAPRHPHLFSAFLSARNRTKRGSGPLVFSVDVAARVPEYELDGRLWLEDHIDGSYLYRDTLTLEAVPPSDERSGWTMRYGYDSRTPGRATRDSEPTASDRGLTFRIPIENAARPGIRASLVLTARSSTPKDGTYGT